MMVSEAQFNVEVNAWLACALQLIVRLAVPGLAWGWLWPADSDARGPWAGRILRTAQVVLTGLLTSIAVVIALAAVNRYTETAEWIALALVTLVGLVAGVKTGTPLFRRLRTVAPGLALLAAGFALVMLLPQRGEWVLGGWDPGIYMNQGVALSRTGRLSAAPDPFFSGLGDSEISLFTRPAHSYLEALPVVPLDRARRALQPFFFPGTPSLIALLYRCGGLRAATRVNDFAGLLTTLVFTAAALGLMRRGPGAFFALAALVAQPLWLYHAHFPTSEMLQLLLLSGLALAFPLRGRSPGAAVLTGALLCAAEINRFSFLPFGLLFVFMLACDDLRRQAIPRIGIERALQFGGLGIGALFAYFSNPVTMERLHAMVPALLGSSVVLALAIVIVEARPISGFLSRRLPGLLTRGLLPLGLMLLGAVLILARFGWLPESGSLAWTCRGAIDFMGGAWLILAALGAPFLIRSRDPEASDLKLWSVFLLTAWAVSLLNPEITIVLPWAARRNLEFGSPLAALLAAGLPAGLWLMGRTVPRAAALLACLIPLGFHGRSAVMAWSATEHDGLTAVLARVADQTEAHDIIMADHFRWGTPLRFLYDRTVINGELYLNPREFARMPQALKVLASLAAPGRRIRFLVSTEKGLDVFPVVPAPATLDWESPPWTDREVVHSARARGVETKEKTRRFRLYTWNPTASSRQN